MTARRQPTPADGMPIGRQITDEEIATYVRAYGPQAASDPPAWANYAAQMSLWRVRCDDLILDILSTPERYLRTRRALWERKHAKPMPRDLIIATDDALQEVRDQLLELSADGQTPVSLANEICGHMGGQPRCRSIILEMAYGGWLPRPPMRPDMVTRTREPVSEAQRQADAEANAVAMVGDTP